MDANQFAYRMSQLPKPETTLKPPFWDAWRLNLWQHVTNGDNPKRFWEWSCVYHTMLVNHWTQAIQYEFSQLTEGYHNPVLVPHFGPDDYFSTSNFSTQFSMNLIHQAYHIQQWEQASGKRINQLDTIVEFGGGYGAMALLCHRLGFGGKYIIYDLPEFSLLQEYYLSQFGLLDKVSWNPKRKPKDVDLLMALYSLSEVEPSKRDALIVRANSYLFLYSGQWEQWNNVEWFKQFAMATSMAKDFNWQHIELGHLPDLQNWYSIGW
jgi:hypothetical protein